MMRIKKKLKQFINNFSRNRFLNKKDQRYSSYTISIIYFIPSQKKTSLPRKSLQLFLLSFEMKNQHAISFVLFCYVLISLSSACSVCQTGCANIAVSALSYKTYQVPYVCQSGPLSIIVNYRATDNSPVEIYFMDNSKWQKVKNGDENWPSMITGEASECVNTFSLSGWIITDATLVVYCPNFISDCDGLISFSPACTDGITEGSNVGGASTEATITTIASVDTTIGIGGGSTVATVGATTGVTPTPVPAFVRFELFSDPSCVNRIFTIEEKLHISSCSVESCAPYEGGVYVSKFCHFQNEPYQPDGHPTIVQYTYDDDLCQNFRSWSAYYLDMKQCYRGLNQTFTCQGKRVMGSNYVNASCSEYMGFAFSLGDDTCDQGVKLTENPCSAPVTPTFATVGSVATTIGNQESDDSEKIITSITFIVFMILSHVLW